MSRDFTIASYCSSRAWGGLEMNVLRFLRWMQARGWKVMLYTRPDAVMHDRAAEFGVPVRTVISNSKLSDLMQGRRLAKMVTDDGVRVLTVHQSQDLLLGVMTKKFARDLKLIYSQHMHIGGDKGDFLHAWQYRAIDAFVTPINWLAERVREKTVVPDERIHIIVRGIDLAPFVKELPSKADARQRLNLPLDKTVVGIVGRLDPKKGQHVLVRALSKVHGNGHRIHLAIIGQQTLHEDSGYEQEIARLVEALGLTDYVHFCPHLEEPAYAYAALDIFVLASKSETYGMVTIEAMCSGLPVIGTDDGGTTELIDHERNGLRFPPENDEALARALLRYLSDPDFARRMGGQAQADGVMRFSHTRQCEQWEKLIDRLVPDQS